MGRVLRRYTTGRPPGGRLDLAGAAVPQRWMACAERRSRVRPGDSRRLAHAILLEDEDKRVDRTRATNQDPESAGAQAKMIAQLMALGVPKHCDTTASIGAPAAGLIEAAGPRVRV